MRIQPRRDIVFFIGAVLASGVSAVLFYRPFLSFLNSFFGPITGFQGLIVPRDWRLPIAVFDFSYVFFLALFLSFRFDWRETLRFWAYGYLLLIGLSIFVAGIYIPTFLRLLFVLVSASIGFLIGQGIMWFVKGRKA